MTQPACNGLTSILPMLNQGKKLTGTILTFGELLLRICPDITGSWLTTNSLPVFVGGSELNVATALAVWGLPSRYLTALPRNPMAGQIIASLEALKIDVSSTFYHGSRIGLYYLTTGQDLKHDSLIYDRAHSAFSELNTGMIDWDSVFEGVELFHFSAICPAISQQAADICLEALLVASERNIMISIDLNYRSKLWQYGKTPEQVMPELVSYCDIIMGNLWAMDTMLGIPVDPAIHSHSSKENYLYEARQSAALVMTRFPLCRFVANTFRMDHSGGLNYYGSLSTADYQYVSAEYHLPNEINRVGSGDCFMAGLLYGLYREMSAQETLDFATAAAVAKFTVAGDAIDLSAGEVRRRIKPGLPSL